MEKMTLEGFYALLRRIKRQGGWTIHVTEGNGIRLKKMAGKMQRCFCPLTAGVYFLRGDFLRLKSWAKAGRQIGFKESVADTIVNAADETSFIWQRRHKNDRRIRSEIAKALGIKLP